MKKSNALCKIAGFILFFFLPAYSVLGQFYDNGQDPASLRWNKIDTRHYRLIFPESFRPEAQRLANLLDYSFDFVNYSLKSNPRKIPVVIHNQSTFSNGMVVWAPKRVEFYTVPDPNSWPQDELEQLVSHELRHVAQIEKINRRFTGTLGYITGELAAGGLSAMIPLWFMEGDAVSSETLMSHSGRGRLPSFEMGVRAISLERGEMYRYDKSLLGSFKNYVPDWYEYGYQVTAWSRKQYGIDLWNHALEKVAGYPFFINPVNVSFWKEAKLTKRRLYDSAFVHLHETWTKQDEDINPTPFENLTPNKPKAFTSYRFPRYLNDSTLVVERSGIDDINRFVRISQDGKEQVMHTPGYYQSVRLSAGGKKIVWAETVYDERWENRTFSVIKLFDPETGREWTMTRRSRYFAPDISPDGKTVAAVRNEPDNTSFIDIIDVKHDRLTASYGLPGNISFFKPVWRDTSHLLVIVLTDRGKEIRELDVQNNRWSVKFEGGYQDIQAVWPAGKYILFHSTFSGIDNIYAVDTTNAEVSRVTSSRFGATDPCVSPDGKEIVYADYSSHGYNLARIPFDPALWEPLRSVNPPGHPSWEPMMKEEKGVIEAGDVPDSSYSIKKYREAAHLFRFHSWLPFYLDYENLAFDELPLSPGVMLFSQNLLSTATGSVAYAYKNNQHQLISRFTYKGFYPVFDMSYSIGGDPIVSRDSSGIPLPESLPARNDFSIRSYIPLNLTFNRFSRGLIPSANLQYTNSFIWNNETQSYDEGRTLLSYRLYYYSLLKQSNRDIRPRLGLTLDLRFTHAPWNKNNYGTNATALGTIYLPGILPHHSLRIQAGTEKQNPSRFYFLNQLSYPRGYKFWLSEKLNTLNASYDFPLIYPDLAVSSLLYISRVRGSLFGNIARGTRNYDYFNHSFIQGTKEFQSFGGELILDFFALRIGFPISLGAWGAWLPDEQTWQTGVSFNVDVYGLSINKRKNKPLRPSWALSPGWLY